MTIVQPRQNPAPPAPSFVGRRFHPGHVVPVTVARDVPLCPASEDDPRLAVLLVRRGSCIVDGPSGPLLVSAPAALLLDETFRPVIHRAEAFAVAAVYFHPLVVNSAFTPRALRQTPRFAGTDEQDAYLLHPFFAAHTHCRPLALSLEAGERMAALADRIAAEGEAQSDDNWPCRTRSYLIELLICLRVFAERPPDAATPASGERIDRALLYVHDHFARGFTIEELARHCGTNRTTLAAAFRRLTGQSVRAYAIALRMQLAATLLRDTLLPVAEILERVGYDNASSFTRTFRAAFGKTPRDYRAAHSWMLRKQSP